VDLYVDTNVREKYAVSILRAEDGGSILMLLMVLK
jgi:hypothetical protein